KGRARSTSAGSIVGNGWTRSSRKEPSNISRTKLGACHSFSRAASATSRASFSVASCGGGPGAGAVITSGMVGFSGGSGGGKSSAQAVQDEINDVPFPLLEEGGILGVDAECAEDGIGVSE